MQSFKLDFVRLALKNGALRLDGPFKLKSGKTSPYFFDTSRFTTGENLGALAGFYVRTLVEALGKDSADVLFGPAYKGIPLAVACALQMVQIYGRDIGYLFDRKEAKLHGEHSADGGSPMDAARKRLVGHPLGAGTSVVLLDDVLTTGGTKVEALELLRAASPQVRILGLIIALDREEKGPGGLTASQEFTRSTGVPVHAVLTAHELLQILRTSGLGGPTAVESLERHLAQAG